MPDSAAPRPSSTSVPGTTGTWPPSSNGSAPPRPEPKAAPNAEPKAKPQAQPRRRPSVQFTGVRAGFVGLVVALVVVTIFIIQNVRAVNVSFLGVHVLLSLALALILAVVVGALAMVAAGPARVTWLRQIARRSRPGPDAA